MEEKEITTGKRQSYDTNKKMINQLPIGYLRKQETLSTYKGINTKITTRTKMQTLLNT